MKIVCFFYNSFTYFWKTNKIVFGEGSNSISGLCLGGKLCYLHKKVYKGTAGTGNRVHASWFYVDDIRYFKSLKSSKFSQNCVIHKCVISKYTRALNLAPLLNHHAKGRTFLSLNTLFAYFIEHVNNLFPRILGIKS